MIKIKIENDTITPALARLAKGMAQMSPVMQAIAGIMHDAVEENFAQGGRPAWAGLKQPVNEKREGGNILIASGHLKNSILPRFDATSAVVGTNVKYAAIHQFGGQTKAHVIRPRYKKALAFGGRVVKKVNHPGSKIPARPFLNLTTQDEGKILRTVNQYLADLVKP
jgi:phage virion morphogenesis protein